MEPTTGKRENIHAFGSTAIQDLPAGPPLADLAEPGKEKVAGLLDQAKDRTCEAMTAVQQSYSELGDRLQESGEYLRERAAKGLEETTGLIRRHPIPALFISFCAGFFLCRMLKD